jgi:hypothetical protein
LALMGFCHIGSTLSLRSLSRIVLHCPF